MLRARGERVTPARRAVLQILDTADKHLNAEEIVTLAADQVPGVHRATVYRALSTLGELQMVTHTHVGGSAAVYHLSVPDPRLAAPPGAHAHLQCTTCGAVIDVKAEIFASVVARLERDLDFRLAPEHAALLGTCTNCHRTSARPGQG
jgi:Fur family ferric uptake transcriptional regulator